MPLNPNHRIERVVCPDKRRAPKRRSAVARSLAHPLFRPRRVPDRRRKLLQAAREADHGDR